jgi:hypothetical protein
MIITEFPQLVVEEEAVETVRSHKNGCLDALGLSMVTIHELG